MITRNLRQFLLFIKKMFLYYKVGMARITIMKAYRMLRYLFLTKILRKEIPWLIEFSVTYACQCKCIHCSVGKYAVERKIDMLTNDEIKNVLTQAAAMGIPKVDLFGGEPLMKKGIVDLIEHGSKLGLYMSVTTNGWLLSREMIQGLKKAGISCINVSLDSDDQEEHDNLRGLKGVFERATEGIKTCYNFGVPCIVSTYVTKSRIVNFGQGAADNSELTRIINFARGLHATGIRILFPIISGNWEERKEQEFTEAEKSLVINHIDPSFAFIEGAYSVKDGKKICQSLHGKMFNISPEGNLQICIAFPDTFGNVREKPLNELIYGMWSHPTYLINKGGDCCSTLDLIRVEDGKGNSDKSQPA